MLEKNNENISLNILEMNENKRFNYLSTLIDRKDKVNLILFEKKHYVYLKNVFGISLAKIFSDNDSDSNSDSDSYYKIIKSKSKSILF